MGPEPSSSGEETSDAVMLEKREQILPHDDVKVPHCLSMGWQGHAFGHLSVHFVTRVLSLGLRHFDLLSSWWVNGCDLGVLLCDPRMYHFRRRGVLVDDGEDGRIQSLLHQVRT